MTRSIRLSLSMTYSLSTSVWVRSRSFASVTFKISRKKDCRNSIPHPCRPSGFSRSARYRHISTSFSVIPNMSKRLYLEARSAAARKEHELRCVFWVCLAARSSGVSKRHAFWYVLWVLPDEMQGGNSLMAARMSDSSFVQVSKVRFSFPGVSLSTEGRSVL